MRNSRLPLYEISLFSYLIFDYKPFTRKSGKMAKPTRLHDFVVEYCIIVTFICEPTSW